MFCPQCGITINEDLKFCKQCGANLHAVRQALTTHKTEEKFDWSRTWVAEMFMSESERERRARLIEEQSGITPEVKRYGEIKAGVITSLVGVGAMIFFYILMQGIILSGEVEAGEAEILKRLWVLGVVPFLIGIGLIFNGLVISKKQINTIKQIQESKEETKQQKSFGKNTDRLYLDPANESDFIPSSFSVTEGTTRTLQKPEQKS